MRNSVHPERAAARRAATLQREKMAKMREAAAGARSSGREAISSSVPGRSAASNNTGGRTAKTGGTALRQAPSAGATARSAVTAGSGRSSSSAASRPAAGTAFDEKQMEAFVALEIKKRRRTRRLIMCVAVIFMVVGLGYFVFYNYNAESTATMYDTASTLRNAGRSVSVNINKTEDKEIPDILEEYSLLYSTHRNAIGWIKIEDTQIDYPVMQLNNEFYLDHNYKGDKDKNGAIFMDETCDVLKPSDNIILYGHHMRSGNMFGGLNKYASEEYGKSHSKIEFDSIYEKGIYEVMYVFQETLKDSADITFKYYQFIDANSAIEFESNMQAMAAMSMYDTGVRASYGDKLLTLSTCDNSLTDGRFVVVAKRVG